MTDAATFTRAKAGDEAAQRAVYLDFVNNFLTVAGFSQWYGCSQRSGEVYLNDWRQAHEGHCAMIKAGKSA